MSEEAAAQEQVKRILMHNYNTAVRALEAVRARINALKEEAAIRDAELSALKKASAADRSALDFLDSVATPGWWWVARWSTTGRGYRLHQAPEHKSTPYELGGVSAPTVRGALRAAVAVHAPATTPAIGQEKKKRP